MPSEDPTKQGGSRDGTPKEKGKDGEGEPSTSHYRQHTATGALQDFF
jgi:hypothetical protein